MWYVNLVCKIVYDKSKILLVKIKKIINILLVNFKILYLKIKENINKFKMYISSIYNFIYTYIESLIKSCF